MKRFCVCPYHVDVGIYMSIFFNEEACVCVSALSDIMDDIRASNVHALLVIHLRFFSF